MKTVLSFLEARWTPVALISGFVILLAVISLGNPACNDEGVWLYIGKMWMQVGALPWVDALENKTPGIYYVYAFASLIPGVGYFAGRVVAVAVSAGTAALILGGLSQYHSRRAGTIGAACFSLAFCWQFVQGTFVNLTETYIVFFAVLAWYFVLKAWDGHRHSSFALPWLVCGGVAIAAAINFKQIAVTTAAAVVLVIFMYGVTKRDWQALFIALSAFGLGVVLGFVGFTLPLLVSGVSLEAYWEGAWVILLQPGTASDAPLTHRIYIGLMKWTSPEMRLFMPFLLYLIYAAVQDPEKRFVAAAFLVWIAFDFAGVNASGHYYGHQFKQILPSICIMAGYVSGEFLQSVFHEEARRRQAFAVLFVTITVLFFPADAFVNGAPNLVFQETDPAREVGLWVREHSSEEDYVQIAGGPITQVLAFTGRRAPSRYFHHSAFEFPGAREGFLQDVEVRQPRYVIFQAESDMDPHPWLKVWVQRHYRPAYEDFGILVYERTGE